MCCHDAAYEQSALQISPYDPVNTAGLAAAVHAASEGLDAVVIESEFPAGQTGASSKIRELCRIPHGHFGAGTCRPRGRMSGK
jgi:glycine/D-amino acid oxidase-like deaminating enzyme